MFLPVKSGQSGREVLRKHAGLTFSPGEGVARRKSSVTLKNRGVCIVNYLSSVFVSALNTPILWIFPIAVAGYLLGSIKVKGVGLETAAVFLVALAFGHFAFYEDSLLHSMGLITASSASIKSTMSLCQHLGLACFVTSVGFIAGPSFFHNLKKNAKSYVLLAATIIGSCCVVCVFITLLTSVDSAMAAGLMCGSLTTTPGFAAAQEAAAGNDLLLNEISAGYAIAYPFGVIGVVLFVQIVPKLLKADMEEERKKLCAGAGGGASEDGGKTRTIGNLGYGAFALAIVLGVIIGKISIPLPGGVSFSLGNTGGMLFMGLVLGHFGRIGNVSMRVNPSALKALQELGLMFFLIGAGVPGGAEFVRILQAQGVILFFYGALMTVIPMIGGFLIATYLLKLSLLNNLGSITGGMTSTPALGALISVAKTSDVASAYAATYPVALVLVVLASQLIVTLL